MLPSASIGKPISRLALPLAAPLRRIAGIPLAWAGLLLLLAAFAFPLNLETVWRDGLSSNKSGFTNPGANSVIHALLQGHPAERCSTLEQEKSRLAEDLETLLKRVRAEPGPPWRRLAHFLPEHRARVQAFFQTPCQGEWQFTDNQPSWVQPNKWLKYYRHVLEYGPMLWLIGSLGMDPLTMVAILTVGSWVGISALFLLTIRLTGSRLAGLVAVAIAVGATALSPPYHLLANLFIPVWAAVEIASPQLRASSRRFQWGRLLAVLLAMGVGGLLLLFVHPSTVNRTILYILLATLLLGGLVTRNRRILLETLLALIVLWTLTTPYRHYTADLLQPYLATDYAQGSGTSIYVVASIGEGPNVYGLPYGDFGYNLMFLRDPLLLDHLPMAAIHHAPLAWGDFFLADMFTHHPGEYLGLLWRRPLTLLTHLRELSIGLLDHPLALWGFHGVLGVMFLAIGLFVIAPRSGISVLSPAVVGLWSLMGLSTLISNYTHTHNEYFKSSLYLLCCLAPGVAWRLLSQARGRPDDGSSPTPLRPWSALLRTRRLGLIVLSGLLLSAPLWWSDLARETRRELSLFPIRSYLDLGTQHAEHVRNIDFFDKALSMAREANTRQDGSFELFSAWIYRGFVDRIHYYRPVMTKAGRTFPLEQEQAKAESRILPLYLQALERGKENPFTGMYAKLLGYDQWPTIFARTLEQWPEHPYGAYLAYELLQATPPGDAARERFARVFDAAQHRLWATSASRRPGYRERPELLSPSSGAPLNPPPLWNEGSEEVGWRVNLPPGERVSLSGVEGFRSSVVDAILYARVLEGRVTLWLEDEKPEPDWSSSPLHVEPDPGASGYRTLSASRPEGVARFRVVIEAGGEGARLVIRDFYPETSRPRLPKKIG